MLNRIAALPRQNSAVGYYRIIQPVMLANKLKLTKIPSYTTRFTGTSKNLRIGLGEQYTEDYYSDKLLMGMARGSDVLYTNLLMDGEEVRKMMDLRKWSGAKWVVDIDDNLYAVSSDNPGRDSAIRLKREIEFCLRVADGLTVSVPALKALYSNLNEHIHVSPNFVDLDWFKPPSKPPRGRLGTRIGWRGAHGHRADVTLVQPAIEELKKQYPELKFVTFGVKPDFSDEHHDWVSFMGNDVTPSYPEKLASLNLDIAVVPLIDSSYNRGKSNLAVQEYSALKVPVVASPTLNQRDDPLLFATSNYEWYGQLERLILSKQLRKEQADMQYGYLKEAYNGVRITRELFKWLEQLEYRTDLPAPK